MQVILLAAGQSTRLDPISDKNTLEFLGKPLIEHQVAALKKAKLRDIVVVANRFNIDKIEAILAKYSNVVVTEQERIEDGMAGGVLAGAEVVKHKNILVMSTNDVFDEKLFEDIIQASKTKGVDGVIAGKKMMQYFPGGYLKLDKHDFITDIIEKPGEGKEPSKFVNLVCHIYNDFPAFVEYLEKGKKKNQDHYETALDAYIKKGKAKILMHKYTGLWQPIKFPWDILKLMNHFLETVESKIDRSASIAKSAKIGDKVYIGPKVKIFDNVSIQGPAYIAEGAVIANNSLVRESMVGRNCVVGFTTEVARSYLNHDVWMHTNYIGDSIIDSNVSFGSGTVLGNLRFDEENVKVRIKGEKVDTGTNKFGAIIGSGVRMGVNSCTNPGVKIGQNVFVGGGLLLDRDIESGHVVLLDQKLKIMKNEKTISMDNREGAKKKLGQK